MTADDAGLARLLDRHVADLFTWLDDYPADQVDRSAVASVRQSVNWVRLAAGKPDPAPLKTAVGILVDLVWWLDTCSDREVDEWAVGNLQESTATRVVELSDWQRGRLLETLNDLAAAEQHDGRRYQLRFFGFAMGLVETEPDERGPIARGWVRPEDRIAGPAVAP
jgi:hypothetical protein